MVSKKREMSDYAKYIAISRYAKYDKEKGRRETWEETVARYINNVVVPKMVGHEDAHDLDMSNTLQQAITNLDVLPSMRCLMTSGEALDRDNVAAFNCSYLPVDHPRSFDEAMYILMCGTGVGFSVERQYVSKLPEVPESFYNSESTIVVRDSKIGWAEAFKELLSALYAGAVPSWDVSRIRPHGARLKTFGGRASGPEPLVSLFKFCVDTFKAAAGRRLSSIECHKIMCKVGEAVVVGGVRRSALISLSNLSDDRMRHAKDGKWWETAPELALANNSVAYTEKPSFDSFQREWVSLYESKSGERGIFNRIAARKQAARNSRRNTEMEFGTNPCSEIILRPYQFCNLSSVVVRPEDTLESLLRKVELATILGTTQATYTNFRYLRSIWRKNTEEEALLGVSLTGVMDHPILSTTSDAARDYLEAMKAHAVDTNKLWAARLGINQSVAITCVKPEGTVSQLTDSASGLHPRYSSYYIRRVRNDAKDPLSDYMKQMGVPWEDDKVTPGSVVFSFPQKAPSHAVLRNDRSAIAQMEHWKMLQDHWCEHKPSITVYYGDDEFMGLGQWVWDNFDSVSGVAFLPRSDHSYQQAPYEECTREEYEAAVEAMPKGVDWSAFIEHDDNTVGVQTLSCSAGSCDII